DAADRTGDGASRRLDLARGDPARVDRLQPVGAEIERGAALGDAMHPALVGLPVFAAFRCEHRFSLPAPIAVAIATIVALAAAGLLFAETLVLRHRVVRQDL